MSFEGLLGSGSAARQLLVYGVGYELARSLLGPMFTQIEYEINNNAPLIELSPAELADLVVRGVIGNQPDAAARAKKFGLTSDKFGELVRLAGEPPGLVQVLEWWRRGFLPWDQGVGEPSVAEAIRTSRIYSYWTDVIKQSQFVPPGPAEAVNAVLRNQITLEQGIAMAYFAGLGVGSLQPPPGADTADTETAFTVLLNARGNPPSLTELLELARRGEIPWGNLDPATKTPNPAEISFAQGIYEGDSKDKWLPLYAKLGVYLPPPRTIVTLLRDGAITPEQAATLFEQSGLSPQLADAYIASATHGKVAGSKQLNESAIIALYEDKVIDQPTALSYLGLLGYTASEGQLLLSTADYRSTLSLLNRNIAKVVGYYVAHKIDRASVSTQLANLGVPPAQITHLLTGADIDRTANVHVLTAGQVASAWEYGILTQDEAEAELETIGYVPLDAWTLLSIKAKGPLPNKPAGGPGLVQ